MLNPLEQQLYDALKLRRATSWPFASTERGGLGLTADNETASTAAHARREAAANLAVDAAIEAAEAAQLVGFAETVLERPLKPYEKCALNGGMAARANVRIRALEAQVAELKGGA